MASAWKSWRFQETGRKSDSSNPGTLIIDEQWRLNLVSTNKAKTILYYGCVCRKTSEFVCPFKAWVGKEDVEGVNKYILIRIIGSHNHPANIARVTADTLKLKMITLCNIKPEATAANIRNEVMEDALKDYKNDEELWREINLELGGDMNLDRMIQRAKQKKVGK